MDLTHLPTSGGVLVIQTPTEIYSRPDLRLSIQTPEQLVAWHAVALKKYHKPDPWHCETPVTAFISANHWVFLCPQCSGGVSCGPAWPIGCCFECGAICDAITYPEAAVDIEAVLLARPALINRNYVPSDTLDTLVVENVSRDLTVGKSAAAQQIADEIAQARDDRDGPKKGGG